MAFKIISKMKIICIKNALMADLYSIFSRKKERAKLI